MEFKDSKTYANLMTTFAGEAQARARYDIYASTAKREGYMQIAAIFSETAANELEHAKRAMALMGLRNGTTGDNLADARDGEHFEWHDLYKGFAQQAKEEGFEEISTFFTEIAEVEEEHEKRYQKLLDNVTQDKVFKKDAPVKWHCRNCGYVHEGPDAPAACPACLHPQSYFEVYGENF